MKRTFNVQAREDAGEADGREGYTGPKWRKINNAAIERGIAILLEKKTKIHQSYKNLIWGASQTNDSGGDMDWTTFDAILQCAMLGDVIYGKECGSTEFFWHCKSGVGSATCLKCKTPDYFEWEMGMSERQQEIIDQYIGARALLGDKIIIFIEAGVFYEAFFEDARILWRVFEIKMRQIEVKTGQFWDNTSVPHDEIDRRVKSLELQSFKTQIVVAE